MGDSVALQPLLKGRHILPKGLGIQGQEVRKGDRGVVLGFFRPPNGIGRLEGPGGVYRNPSPIRGDAQAAQVYGAAGFFQGQPKVREGNGHGWIFISRIQGLFCLPLGHIGQVHRAKADPIHNLPVIGVRQGKNAVNAQGNESTSRYSAQRREQPLGGLLFFLFYGLFRFVFRRG